MMQEFAAGAIRTIELAIVAWMIGLPLGVAAAVIGQLWRPARRPLHICAITIVIIPALAILFWLHYPLQQVLRIVVSPTITAGCLLSIYVWWTSGDVILREMVQIEESCGEAAIVLGIPPRVFMSRVLFAGALQKSLPRLLTLAIVSVHMTMFTSLIGVEELFRVAQRLNAQYLRPVQIYTVMAAVYAILCLPLYVAMASLRRRLDRYNYGA